MSKTKKLDKKRIYLIIGVAAFVLIVLIPLAFYFLPGGVRERILPNHVDANYPAEVSRSYDEAFTPAIDSLRSFGLPVTIPSAPFGMTYEYCSKYYSGFPASYRCTKSNSATEMILTGDTVTIWQNHAKQFEQYLLDSGWSKTEGASIPIENLLSGQHHAGYQKNLGQTVCTLAINHSHVAPIYQDNQPITTDRSYRLDVTRSCHKTLRVFGGYDAYF